MERKPRLLIAEDEGLVALSMEMFLSDTGYEVCAIARSAPETVLLAEKHRPDLALMDVRLAGDTDGLDAAREMRRRWGIPSILLTGTGSIDMDSARAAGAMGVLRKPFEPDQLIRMILAALLLLRGESVDPLPVGLIVPSPASPGLTGSRPVAPKG